MGSGDSSGSDLPSDGFLPCIHCNPNPNTDRINRMDRINFKEKYFVIIFYVNPYSPVSLKVFSSSSKEATPNDNTAFAH